jgi:hypothetical protein
LVLQYSRETLPLVEYGEPVGAAPKLPPTDEIPRVYNEKPPPEPEYPAIYPSKGENYSEEILAEDIPG